MSNRDNVAEWLRRQLKALVRKSEGSNPSVIIIFALLYFEPASYS